GAGIGAIDFDQRHSIQSGAIDIDLCKLKLRQWTSDIDRVDTRSRDRKIDIVWRSITVDEGVGCVDCLTQSTIGGVADTIIMIVCCIYDIGARGVGNRFDLLTKGIWKTKRRGQQKRSRNRYRYSGASFVHAYSFGPKSEPPALAA